VVKGIKQGGDVVSDETGRTPTAWELLRTMDQIRQSQDRIEARMVTKDEFQAWQLGTDRRFTEQERQISDVRTAAASESAKLAAKMDAMDKRLVTEIEKVESDADTKIKAEAAKREKLEDQQRDTRLRIWVGILLVAAGVIIPKILELV